MTASLEWRNAGIVAIVCFNICCMAEDSASISGEEDALPQRKKFRVLVELAVAYALILIVCWTPHPWQRLLWLVTAAAIVLITAISFDGLQAMGLRKTNFLRSLWVVGAALLLAAAAVLVAAKLNTLHLPGTFVLFIKTYFAYSVWAAVQQFLMQCFFLLRLLRLLPSARFAAVIAALIFALAHLPNPILTSVTLIWGFAACLVFLRYRNLYPLAMAHAIFGIAIAVTVPGPVDHNMRVGLGYLTYGHTHNPPPSQPK
jgi:membrane protease YdiL (CAAX protease family)